MLADYAYDNLGNRTGVTFEGGTAQAFGYDPVSRLASLTNDLSGTPNDLSVTFAYNPASEIIQTVRTGDAYAFTGHVAQNTAGVANGLNQLTSVGGTAATYDAKGNLTSDPTSGKTYTYSSENLLTTGSGSVTATYDPMTRLSQIAGAATTKFAYDGVDALAEYGSTGSLQRRFVFDPTTGQPVVQYEGTGVAAANRRYLSQDERGSVISLTDSAGVLIGINTYDEYGIPGAANVGRFQYTGQAWLPELGLYYYKARMYSPKLGRFAQTDPIGYADSPNLYNYVLGDPVNNVDPLGLCTPSGGPSYPGENCSPVDVVGRRLSYVWWPRTTQIIIGDTFNVIPEGGYNFRNTDLPDLTEPVPNIQDPRCKAGQQAAGINTATTYSGWAHEVAKGIAQAGGGGSSAARALGPTGWALSGIGAIASFVGSSQTGESWDVGLAKGAFPVIGSVSGGTLGGIGGGALGGSTIVGAVPGAAAGVVLGSIGGEKLGDSAANGYANLRGEGGCP